MNEYDRMGTERDVTLWPTRENYGRFRFFCDDELPETFDEFEAQATARLKHIERMNGIRIDKVLFNPDTMGFRCRTSLGGWDAHAPARQAYADIIAFPD